MADEIEPSVSAGSDAYLLAQVIYQGALTDWIQPDSSTLLADHASNINNGALPLGAFGLTYSASSLTVTVDTGEGFIGGAYVATDDTHDVTLDASTNGQAIFVGWDFDSTNALKVGRATAFSSSDPKLRVWTVDTDETGVVGTPTDERPLGQQSSFGQVTFGEGSTFDRWVSSAIASTAVGTSGDTQGEVYRVPGAASDLVFAVETGQESFALVYNAYLDSGSWKSIVSGETYRIAFDTNGVELSHATTGTADETITWTPYGVDGPNFVNGTTVLYDGVAGEFPEARLGGPAGSLTSYPLPPGDLDGSDGGATAGDVLYTDGTDGYWDAPPSAGTTTVFTDSDAGDGTAIDWDTGVLGTTYDVYEVECVYASNLASAENRLFMRVNGDGTTAYRTGTIDFASGVINRRSGTNWGPIAETDEKKIGHFKATIRGNSPSGSDAATVAHPTVSFEVGGDLSDAMPFAGTLLNDHETVNRIEVYSDGDATGDIAIRGRNL